MIESHMRQIVVEALKPLHAVSVENPCHPGTPDINCSVCWIELKALDAWPAREDTPVRIPHFTAQQRIWLQKRYNAGGQAFLLLSVGTDWLLFSAYAAARYVGCNDRWASTQSCLRELALRTWHGTPPARDLIECLSP